VRTTERRAQGEAHEPERRSQSAQLLQGRCRRRGGYGPVCSYTHRLYTHYTQNSSSVKGEPEHSTIDPKSAIWNKGLNLTQIPGLRYTPTQLDALTFAKVNVLRYKGANTAPVLLHDRTAAILDSDFTFLLRMNIHDLVIDTLCSRDDQYEGQSTLDGLQMTSMKSAMDEGMVASGKFRGSYSTRFMPGVLVCTLWIRSRHWLKRYKRRNI
jgi:hypothetical protein